MPPTILDPTMPTPDEVDARMLGCRDPLYDELCRCGPRSGCPAQAWVVRAWAAQGLSDRPARIKLQAARSLLERFCDAPPLRHVTEHPSPATVKQVLRTVQRERNLQRGEPAETPWLISPDDRYLLREPGVK